MLPPTATIIKVTNVLTPYVIRIYEVKQYNERLNSINKKLFKKEKTLGSTEECIEPKIGDVSLACDISIIILLIVI